MKVFVLTEDWNGPSNNIVNEIRGIFTELPTAVSAMHRCMKEELNGEDSRFDIEAYGMSIYARSKSWDAGDDESITLSIEQMEVNQDLEEKTIIYGKDRKNVD